MNLPKKYDWLDVSDLDFKSAIDLIFDTSENLNIIGPAGTGKSQLIHLISDLLPGNVAICSTTGISATALSSEYVKAVTLHSLFRLAPLPYFSNDMLKVDYAAAPVLKAIDTLIIDEVSMLSSHMFDVIFKLLVLYKGSVSKLPRIILFSDILQLPPVVNLTTEIKVAEMFRTEYLNKIMYFNSKFFADTQFKSILLKKLQRQKDPVFQETLNRIRFQQHTKHDLEFLNQYVRPFEEYEKQHPLSMYIASTNKVVDEMNQRYFTLFEGKETIYRGVLSGIFDLDKIPMMDRVIKLKPGMQVMCTKNNSQEGYQNGSLGKVVSCGLNSVEVELINGDTVNVGRSELCNYEYYRDNDGSVQCRTIGKYSKLDARPSKAISVHKSQGKTLEAIYCDFGTYQFVDSLVYVGLSRLKDVKNLGLKRPLKMTDIRANKESLAFLESI